MTAKEILALEEMIVDAGRATYGLPVLREIEARLDELLSDSIGGGEKISQAFAGLLLASNVVKKKIEDMEGK